MDVEGDIPMDSFSSVVRESMESAQEEDKLSDDDSAWVNSCLVTDTEILEGKWTSFKDVLLEIIDDKPESSNTTATGSDDLVGGTELKILPSIEKAEAANYAGRTDDELGGFPNNGDTETNTNGNPIKRKKHSLSQLLQEDLVVIPNNGHTETNTNDNPFKRRTHILSQLLQEDSTETFLKRQPFQPTYNEDESKDSAIDLGLQMSLSADEMNSSIVDIFKVWDLNIITETETSFQSVPWEFDDLTAWTDSKDEPLDTLIAGIADLSLNTKDSSEFVLPY